jgi:membrane protein YdbS with pleckstrin-like domain
MEILNTIDRGLITEFTGWVLVVVLLAVFIGVMLSIAEDGSSVAFGIIGFLAIIALIITLFTADFRRETDVKYPLRHEVTIRDGYVIDATQYEIIEQRGDIYVIEERKVAE